MRRIRLGRTEAEISAVGIGTWAHGGPKSVGGHEVGWSGHDDAEAASAVLEAYAAGVDHFDTADVYGDGRAEGILGGLWDQIPRESVFLASKVGWDPGPYGQFYHPDLVASRLDRSLELLRTDHLDLYYLHHCDFGPGDERLDPVLEVLARAREAGKFRHLGLSDWASEKVLRVGRRVEPDVVQVYRNVLDDQYVTSGLASWVEERDLGAVFFSALKHGVLLGKYGEPVSFPKGDMRNGITEFRDPEALARFARCRKAVESRLSEHPEPVLHALIGALLGQKGSCALLGMRNRRQARAAAQLGQALTAEDAEWIRTIYRDGPKTADSAGFAGSARSD